MAPKSGKEQPKLVSKAERKLLRQQANSEWKNVNRASWSDKDANPRHTLYYKAQLPELVDEWDRFHEAMVHDLPVTFRISERCSPAISQAIAHRLETEFKKLRGRFVEVKGQVISNDLVVPIKWYPNAYQVSHCDSASLAKQASLQPLYQYISREVNLGHIVRQELVSMIPAYLLDVKHDSIVMDMCAAPGSKTEQLLALMHQDHRRHRQSHPSSSALPTGMVVANDSDPKRINTLLNRFAHWGAANLMFTCCRAEEFTQHFSPLSAAAEISASTAAPAAKLVSQFNRILCDVPCSGDGTFRKCPHLWRLFRPRGSLDFHTIQLQIATAGIRLLTVGGRLAYSTCSLNPIEDEAVVAALLTHFKGQIRLIDRRAAGQLPLLRSREGISQWACDSEILTVGEEDAASKAESVARLPKILPSMLPPSPEAAKEMHLHRCLRIMPHDQDTGGFFIAVFERYAAAPSSPPADDSVVKDSGKRARSGDGDCEVSEKKHKTAAIESVQIVGGGSSSSNCGSGKTSAKSSSSSGSGGGDISQSLSAMKRLGYNPKNLGAISKEGQGYLLACQGMEEHSDAVIKGLGLDDKVLVERKEQHLMVCTVAKEFASLMDTKKASKQEESEKKPAPKKVKYNGIFGTKASGWAIQKHSEEDEEDEESFGMTGQSDRGGGGGPTHRVVMMSDRVYKALHAWGRRIFIVQAGASIATGHWRRDCGFQQLTLDDSGVDVVAACLKQRRRIELNTSDFLFFLRKGLPIKKEAITTTTTETDGDAGMDTSEPDDREEEAEDASSLLIKRKYIDVADYLIPSDEILPDQLMLSSSGCSSVYEYVDSLMEDGEDEGESGDEGEIGGAGGDGNVVVTDVIVSLNAESWSACCASGKEVSAGGGEAGGAAGAEGQSGGKRRLSKAEKKKLQKQQSSGSGGNTAANTATSPSPTRDEVSATASPAVPPPEGIHLVLNYEAVLTTNKKGTKYTGYNLKLDVLSPEDICRSVSDIVGSYVKQH